MQYIHYFRNSKDFSVAWEEYQIHLDFNLIMAIQSWCLMLMILFVTAQELIIVIHPKRMHDIFFSKKTDWAIL